MVTTQSAAYYFLSLWPAFTNPSSVVISVHVYACSDSAEERSPSVLFTVFVQTSIAARCFKCLDHEVSNYTVQTSTQALCVLSQVSYSLLSSWINWFTRFLTSSTTPSEARWIYS